VGTFTPGLARCEQHSTPPPAHQPRRKVGRLTGRNYFPYGQCTWFAEQRFAEFAHHFPLIWGNASQWAGSAAANGWSVVSTPQMDSVAVFRPGENGALSDGHVAWVTAVNGSRITVEEMNVRGLGVRDTRTLTPGRNVTFILAA
jgi:surface antigen